MHLSDLIHVGNSHFILINWTMVGTSTEETDEEQLNWNFRRSRIFMSKKRNIFLQNLNVTLWRITHRIVSIILQNAFASNCATLKIASRENRRHVDDSLCASVLFILWICYSHVQRKSTLTSRIGSKESFSSTNN